MPASDATTEALLCRRKCLIQQFRYPALMGADPQTRYCNWMTERVNGTPDPVIGAALLEIGIEPPV